MSPQIGKEIYLTELEVAVMEVFVKYKLFADKDVIHDLEVLITKLKGIRSASRASPTAPRRGSNED